jgi:hypothetical protein
MRFHDNLHILIQRDQEAQQAFDGELAEVAAQHLRDIGLADAEQICRLHLLQSAFLQDRVNLEHELRLNQVLFGIGHAYILEHVAAASRHGFIIVISLYGGNLCRSLSTLRIPVVRHFLFICGVCGVTLFGYVMLSEGRSSQKRRSFAVEASLPRGTDCFALPVGMEAELPAQPPR